MAPKNQVPNEIPNVAARFLNNLTNGMILGIGLFLMFVGISLSVSLGKTADLTGKLLIALVTELGFAFFIAWVIICTVDEREKKEHAKKVEIDERRLASKLYLNTVLNLDLPASVSEELSTYIAGSSLLKEFQSVCMKIEKCGNHTKLTQHFEVVFTNVDRSPRPWCPTFDSYDNRQPSIEELHPNESWGYNKIEVKKREANSENWIDITSKQPSEFDGETEVQLIDEIMIERGDQVKVFIQQTCSKFGSDNELFTNKALTNQLDLEISYDEADFEVNYRAIHPRETKGEMRRVDDTDKIRFHHPFLPSHGVVIWWRPKAD